MNTRCWSANYKFHALKALSFFLFLGIIYYRRQKNENLNPHFILDVLRLKCCQRRAGIRTSKGQSFFRRNMANIGPQMIDSTHAKADTTRGLFNMLKLTFGEGYLNESNKEHRWTQFFANSASCGPLLRNAWISLQQQHASSSLRLWRRPTKKSRE
jgi:hypothetical protein